MNQIPFSTEIYLKEEKDRLIKDLSIRGFGAFEKRIIELFDKGCEQIFAHGDFMRWAEGFAALPEIKDVKVSFSDCVTVSSVEQQPELAFIQEALQSFIPWRKGPFEMFGVAINTEWRSDYKWQRVVPHISLLKGRRVLDIGCGSGYHLWRMLEQGAALALGIDTSALFTFHFASIKRYAPNASAYLIPTGIDEMPNDQSFDTVFSMGILYHRKSPIEHLYKIKSLLKQGGEVVLETLVVEGDENTCLVPAGRYAKMRNVWFIPSVAMLILWMEKVGFKDVRCVDINDTSTDEQRVTDWMRFESLADYLDPTDRRKTVEGHPAPKRAVLVAHT